MGRPNQARQQPRSPFSTVVQALHQHESSPQSSMGPCWNRWFHRKDGLPLGPNADCFRQALALVTGASGSPTQLLFLSGSALPSYSESTFRGKAPHFPPTDVPQTPFHKAKGETSADGKRCKMTQHPFSTPGHVTKSGTLRICGFPSGTAPKGFLPKP